MGIIWEYQYVPEGQMDPDTFGRWQIKGYLNVNSENIPGYEWIKGSAPVAVAFIEKSTKVSIKKFIGYCPTFFDLDNGMSLTSIHGDTIEEVKELINTRLERVSNIFKNAK